MPMSPTNVANTARPSVVSVGTSASKVANTVTSEPNTGGDFQVVSLDQLKVVEGVFRRDQVNSPEDLVLGDEFQFQQTEDQLSTSRVTKAEMNSIEVFTGSRFGPSSFSATVTHTVIFMSETGQQLCGYVLDSSKNAATRPSIILRGEANSASNYILIDMSVGRKELDCPAVAAGGNQICAPVSGFNSTWGAA